MKKLSIFDVKRLEVNDIADIPKDKEVSFTSFQAFILFLKKIQKVKRSHEVDYATQTFKLH